MLQSLSKRHGLSPRLRSARSRLHVVAQAGDRSIFVFGLNGYTAVGLGNLLASRGWHVAGTCRSSTSLAQLQGKGWQPYLFDPGARKLLSDDGLKQLAASGYVLSSIPPLGLPLYDPALQEQLRLLQQPSTSCKWFGYLSSTGVYGDWAGDWVDESSPCNTQTSRGLVRKAAEDSWSKAHKEHGVPLHIFRLGGIYGPGRSALEAALQGEAGVEASATKQRRAKQKYTSRCHVLDICQVIEASMARPRPGAIYNIVDDDPAPRQQVVQYAAALLSGQTPAAPMEQLDPVASLGESQPPTPRARASVLEEKRVRNGLIKEELGVQLAYPTYREGLEALHARRYEPFPVSDLQAGMFCRPGGQDT